MDFEELFFYLLFGALVHVGSAETVEFGACYHEPTNAWRCEVNSTYCNAAYDEQWMTPHEMQRVAGRNACTCDQVHVGGCSPQHGSRGTCRTEIDACPAETESFRTSYRFYNDGGTCMCHGETAHPYSTLLVDFELTQYGACLDGSSGSPRCVFDSRSCENDETWISPEALTEPTTCPCTKVRTGACFHELATHCAIDQDSCLDHETFISPFDTMSGGFECLLCDANSLQNDLPNESNESSGSNQGGTVAGSPTAVAADVLSSGERTIPNVAFALLLTVAVLTSIVAIVLTACLWHVQRPTTKANTKNADIEEADQEKKNYAVTAVSVCIDDEPPAQVPTIM